MPGQRSLMYHSETEGRDENMKPQMLCVHMEPGRLMRVSLIAGSLGITVKEIKKEQWGQRLEALFGLRPMGPASGKIEIGGEMAVLAFFPDELIDELTQAIRKNGMERPRLMAVLTPTNRTWTLERLYQELKKEYDAMNARK